MSFNIEWTNADALTPKQFTVYESVPVTYSTTTAPFGDLQRENAKLRELVRVFYHCTTSGECDECPINGGGPVRLMPDTICDTIHDRMHELGVEV